MASIFDSGITRKQFLEKTLQMAGLAVTIRYPLHNFYHEEVLRIALLSDTHVAANQAEVYRGFFPGKNIERVLDQVQQSSVNEMIICGDIARLEGTLGDYAAIKSKLDAMTRKLPMYLALGNHDDRSNFYKVFNTARRDFPDIRDKHVTVIEHPFLTMIFLDSLMYVNKTPGYLGKEQRDWLASYLEQAEDRPVFIFVHHTLGDTDGELLDADRLFRIVETHKKVKAIFYGHSHVYHIGDHGHIKLINLPAVGYNFIDSQPVGWIEANITRQSGRFTLHAIGGNIKEDGESIELSWN